MSRDFTERDIDQSEKIVIRDNSTQKVRTLILPHATQIGLSDDRYHSSLTIQGSANIANNLMVTGSLKLGEASSTPNQPADGTGGIFYVKSDGKPYFRSYEQAEIDLTSGGGGGAVSSVANGANNRIATFSSANALNGEANLTFDGTDIVIAGSGKMAFRDNGAEAIYSVADGTLGIIAQTEIDLTSATVEVNGILSVSSDIRHTGDADTKIVFGSDQIQHFAGGNEYIRIISEDVGEGSVIINDASASDIDFRVESNNNANMLFVDASTDRVGIGTSTPDEPLHAKESIATSGVSNSVLKLETFISNGFTDGDGPGIKFSGGDSNASDNTIGRIYSARDGADNEGKLGFMAGTNGAEEFLTIKSSGLVGIGTTAPAHELDVRAAGEAAIQVKSSGEDAEVIVDAHTGYEARIDFAIAGTQKYTMGAESSKFELGTADALAGGGFLVHHRATFNMSLGQSTNYLYYDYGVGWGIGKTTPQHALDVNGTVHGTSLSTSGIITAVNTAKMQLILKNATSENTDGGCESEVVFRDHADAHLASIEGSHEGSSDDTKGRLRFFTHDGSSSAERMRITSTGKVGIGTTDPTYELDVRAANARAQIKSSGSTALMFIDAATDHDAILYFRENGSNRWLVGNDATDDLLKFDNNNSFASPAMTISTAGVVTAGKFVGITYGTKAINADVTSSTRTFMPISDQYYADDVTPSSAFGPYVWMAPCDGKFIKIRAKMESAAGSSYFRMYTVTAVPGGAIDDPTQAWLGDTGLTNSQQTNTVSVSANTVHTFTFSNASFSAGDIIALSFDGANIANQMIASLIIEYDWSTV